MNERVMQFRIGMFVIVAGLVLTMMVVWFGESPSLLRDQVYLKVRYAEAPGVLEGVPVRKSGIRIGEVASIAFDERPNQPDGVLVTLALERKYKLRSGTVPRITRSLIGDVAIDMLPGTGDTFMETGTTPLTDKVVEGDVAPDPSKALAAATKAFEKAGDTLEAINQAANGLSKISKSAGQLDDFLTTWNTTGQKVSAAAQGIDRVIKANENDLGPAIANLRKITQKFDETIGPETQDALRTGIARFSSASAKLDSGLTDLEPAFKDLGGTVKRPPTTDVGQVVRRMNMIAADVELLASKLRDAKGGLNTEGSLQKLLVQSDLHDNINKMAVTATAALTQLKAVLVALRSFADKVSNDPSSIGRGALRQ
jgi:phospholipid/cholesterol/gamma-HCH transport system substrate-binding protein